MNELTVTLKPRHTVMATKCTVRGSPAVLLSSQTVKKGPIILGLAVTQAFLIEIL